MDRWIRRPRRSTGDRKVAGVAGGLGRAFGIDPVLIRVAFVVLTISGGFGGLLYVLGWLLLPADGDEVSAAEALLGRGRSSVPPPLAVGLGVVAVVGAFSTFSWGLPFLPLVIGGAIALAIMRRRGLIGHQGGRAQGASDHWPWHGRPPADWMQRTDEQVRMWSDRIEGWAGSAGQAGRGVRPGGTSPFEQPAFWEQPAAATRVDLAAPGAPGGQSGSDPGKVDLRKPTATSVDDRLGEPTPRTTPPAWDPLGVAPFAWDLPEPTPLPQPSSVATRRGRSVVGRVAMGATLLIGGLTAVGVFAGWWALTWAQVSGIALGVLGLGLLVSALRGRGYSLIGPGVFLSLVTMALAVTGISGTTGYGATTIHPSQLADGPNIYSWNAGDLNLDLSSITFSNATMKTVTVDLKAGHARVIVPAGMNVAATCTADVGQVDCLGQTADGVKQQVTAPTTGADAKSGTLNVIVKVHAGFAEVTHA